jgi:hypothetical protein
MNRYKPKWEPFSTTLETIKSRIPELILVAAAFDCLNLAISSWLKVDYWRCGNLVVTIIARA